MNTEVKELVDQVARILNIHVGHFDHYKFGKHYDLEDDTIPLVIAYPGGYRCYVFLITDKLEIYWEYKPIMMLALKTQNLMKEKGVEISDLNKDYLGAYKNYQEAEKWLQENEEMVRRVLENHDPKVITYRY